MKKLKRGFNQGFNNEQYHAEKDHNSSSTLKIAYKSIGDYKDQVIDGNSKFFANKTALDVGSLTHAMILEPHVIKDEFVFFNQPSKNGDEFVELFKKYKDTNMIIIDETQKEVCDKLVDNFNKTKILDQNKKEVMVSTFFQGGNAEETLCTTLDGLKIKVRFDYRKMTDEYASINDIKTTSSKVSTPKEAEKVCKMWEYDVSAALYCDAVEKETGRKHDFYFVFLSKKDGKTTIFKASEQMLETGRRKYKIAIKKILEARETGIWEEGISEIDSI